MANIIVYTRVSTDKQDYERQINDLLDFAKKQNHSVVKVFSEKISGVKLNGERRELSNMVDYCLTNNVDIICVSELSRLGRNTLEVLKVIETLNENKISLYIANLGIETLTLDKEISITSKLMITLLAEFASMERIQIQQRMKSGYNNYRTRGGKVGRKKGQIKTDEELKQEHKDIIKYLKAGQSIRNTAKLTGKSIPTVQKIKKIFC